MDEAKNGIETYHVEQADIILFLIYIPSLFPDCLYKHFYFYTN